MHRDAPTARVSLAQDACEALYACLLLTLCWHGVRRHCGAVGEVGRPCSGALTAVEVQEKLDREVRAREAQKAAEEKEAAERKRAAAERASVVAQHALLSQPVGDDDGTAAAAGADQPYDPESVPWDSGMMDMSFDDGAGEESPQQEVLSISDPGTPPAEMARRMEDDVQMADVAAADAPGADPAYEPQGGQRGGVQPGEVDRNATPPLTDAQRAALPGGSASGAVPDRLPRISAGSAGVGNDGGAAFTHVEDFAPLVLSTPEGQVGGGAPGVRLWSGFVEFFGDGLTMRAELASLQGAADLSAVVRGAIVVKGTLATSALLSFFEQLVNSRSRTVTLGVLRVSKKGLDEASLERITKVRSNWRHLTLPGNVPTVCTVVAPAQCVSDMRRKCDRIALTPLLRNLFVRWPGAHLAADGLRCQPVSNPPWAFISICTGAIACAAVHAILVELRACYTSCTTHTPTEWQSVQPNRQTLLHTSN